MNEEEYIISTWAGLGCLQVFQNSRIFQKPDEYFLQHDFLLDDSAYQCTPFLIPVFKHSGGLPLCNNGILAHLQIVAEHAIGILKEGFKRLISLR
jgi:hypothetical protein